jgi:hypothetical protein
MESLVAAMAQSVPPGAAKQQIRRRATAQAGRSSFNSSIWSLFKGQIPRKHFMYFFHVDPAFCDPAGAIAINSGPAIAINS